MPATLKALRDINNVSAAASRVFGFERYHNDDDMSSSNCSRMEMGDEVGATTN